MCFQRNTNGAPPAYVDGQCALRQEATMFEEMKTESQLDAKVMTETRFGSHNLESSNPASFIGLRNILPSDVAIVSPFVDQLMRFISKFQSADESNYEIELALREALVNAIVHGNQNDPRKLVYVNCRCTADGNVSITVKDEGDGFEHDAVADPTSPDNLLRTNGRGIYLIRTLMDEVDFEQGGSLVHMRKKATAAPDARRKAQ
jgi:serine/threonine-protein kinase RsbW